MGWGQTNAFFAGDVTFPSTTLPRTQLIQLTWGRHKIMLQAQTQAKSMSLIGLGFFLLPSFPTFLHQWSGLNQLPQESASLSVCCESNKKGSTSSN